MAKQNDQKDSTINHKEVEFEEGIQKEDGDNENNEAMPRSGKKIVIEVRSCMVFID